VILHRHKHTYSHFNSNLDVLNANLAGMGPDDDCWIVHNVSRGLMKPGPTPAQTNPATIMIFTSPMDLRGWARFYSEGCHAVTSFSRAIPAQSLDARIKNSSRLFYTMADTEARLVDPNAQCVILDVDGYVSKSKGGNLFLVSEREAGKKLRRSSRLDDGTTEPFSSKNDGLLALERVFPTFSRERRMRSNRLTIRHKPRTGAKVGKTRKSVSAFPTASYPIVFPTSF
jgi:hypothetical protein